MIWEVAPEPTLRAVQTLAGHTSGVIGMAWSPDGQRLTSSSDDNSVLVWEVGPASSGRSRIPTTGGGRR